MTTQGSAVTRNGDPAVSSIVQAGIRLILEQQTSGGAYPASPSFSAYAGYCWFRDGSYIAEAMSAAGEIESAERFFDWCSSVLTSRAGRIRHLVAESLAGRPVVGDQMLPTRFTLDGAEGNDDWWDFQLDGYGTWLWALAEHSARHDRPLERWTEAIALTVDYLSVSWDRPCYDWWEEAAQHVHVSTLGCIASGLASIAQTGLIEESLSERATSIADQIRRRVQKEGVQDIHLTKWLGTDTVDASLLSLIAPMNFLPPHSPLSAGTIAVIEEQLTVDNGVHRYLADTYYGGGQWPLLSCFLGLAQAASGNRSRAHELLEWAASTAGANDELPEQVDRHLLDPEHLQPWIERWGYSANPLLWSHAMFIRLAIALGVPYDSADPTPAPAAKENAK
ncbi:glycoside hydrolase family 15 [Arthrobacter sp. SRS-W-1-2016]|jgi:GH15 family glucan-1,4-alpha-glucosidase|uniref:glycoside hydrolase family 15 protein n=1 Tax=Arthrobacter sp. SRS-W-1-2016 TaxID=1930254 RepID=UPI00099140DA|nr:glycoside hydrolase family 15 protein [Arthrobacter sp. SRS-W-1-2016]OOP61895.1 glycoside hydrolase family 15 [Arthrobacter sp. SRS-W-1-2016]